MPYDNSTVIVIPAFNEAPRLGAVLASLQAAGHTVVVVDDGSADGTADIAMRYRTHVLSHPVNLGQGAAIRTGLDYALNLGAEHLVTFDADGQHDASDLQSLLAPLSEGKADVVFGTRFGAARQETPGLRAAFVRVGTRMYCLVSGARLTDANCGLRAFNRQAAQRIRIRQNRMAHTLEIIDETIKHRLRYTEVPVCLHYTPASLLKGQKLSGSVSIFLHWLLRQ